VPLAEWKVRGSDVIGQMQGCRQCGLVVIQDRRGTLLVAPGGFGSIHKRIFPCQRTPPCRKHSRGGRRLLDQIRHLLTAKHDPRFQILNPS
jgi:hypothetical protein